MILHTTELGQGPPLALLHGLFGRAQNLATLARGLAPDFRVLSLDLRNHGASPHASGMDYRALAADVLETLTAHGALPARLLGHSMGGKTAMAAALTHPHEITRLLVADIAPVAYAHHNAAVAAALQAVPLRPGLTRTAAVAQIAPTIPDPAVRSFLLQNLLPGATPSWRIDLDEIAAAIADIEGFPTWPSGTHYPGPVLFLSGANSDFVGPSHRSAIAALFPHAEMTTLADAGHWLHAEQPAAFLAAVRGFMSR